MLSVRSKKIRTSYCVQYQLPDRSQTCLLIMEKLGSQPRVCMTFGREPGGNSMIQVFPLPVEGAETKVLADDQEVANYMIGLADLLEKVSFICEL